MARRLHRKSIIIGYHTLRRRAPQSADARRLYSEPKKYEYKRKSWILATYLCRYADRRAAIVDAFVALVRAVGQFANCSPNRTPYAHPRRRRCETNEHNGRLCRTTNRMVSNTRARRWVENIFHSESKPDRRIRILNKRTLLDNSCKLSEIDHKT